MQQQFRRTWVEIDLDNLKHNYRTVRSLAAEDVKIMAVVKADGYGHGSVQVARTLERCGVDWFAVSNLLEAVTLRRAGIERPILILGYTPTSSVMDLFRYDVTQAIFDVGYAEELAAQASRAEVTVKAHLKLDTGMSRIGLSLRDREQLLTDIARICFQPSLHVTGIFTHFAVADEDSDNSMRFTRTQHERFMSVVEELRSHCIEFEEIHCCNSAASVFAPSYPHTLIRPGIVLYGLSPTGAPVRGLDLRPVMEMKTVVSMVKDLYPGESVSYGCTFTARERMRIATLPVGYADGYPRALSGKGYVYVGDRLVPILGRICMDQMMIDVTDVDVREGDVVTLFGGSSPIGLDNMAGLVGTISYELMCGISRRVERIYIEDGKLSEVVDYTL